MVTVEGLCPEQIDEDRPRGTRVVSLADAGPVVDALCSTVARRILSELRAEPTNAATLADRVDTSVQNVGYHLDRLCEVDLVATVGSQYSEKGREIDVYAATTEVVVIRPDPGGPEAGGGTSALVRTAE